MRIVIFALSLLLTGVAAFANCTGSNLSVNADDQTLNAAFAAAPPALKAGDEVTISIGSTELKTSVRRVDASLPGSTSVFLAKPTGAEFRSGILVLNTDLTTEEAQLNYKDSAGKEQSATLCLVGQFNTRSHSMHIGPTTGKKDAGAAEKNGPSAIRLQYESSFRRFVATKGDEPKSTIPSMRLMQQEFGVSVDTTNERNKGFVDDNRVMAGFFSPRMSLGNALNRVRAGIAGQHARAFHGSNNNSDITLTVDGGVPFFQAANIATPVRRLASPLSFRASAGKRWQSIDDVQSHGDLAEWSFLYHVYVLASYRIDLEHRTLFNDATNRAATTPRTQHSWKATMFYLGDETSRFSAIASYENGHSGPVFTKLRQFFVGVGVKSVLGSVSPKP